MPRHPSLRRATAANVLGGPNRRADRSFAAFLRCVRTEPGFSWRVAALPWLFTSVVLREGLRGALVALLIGVALSAVVGHEQFRYFRRHGRLLGGWHRPGST